MDPKGSIWIHHSKMWQDKLQKMIKTERRIITFRGRFLAQVFIFVNFHLKSLKSAFATSNLQQTIYESKIQIFYIFY